MQKNDFFQRVAPCLIVELSKALYTIVLRLISAAQGLVFSQWRYVWPTIEKNRGQGFLR